MTEEAQVAAAQVAPSLRRCLASGESLPPERLIRFVVAPDGTLTPDIERRLPGRGMWVQAEAAAIAKAMAKGLFSRAARAKVIMPADLPQRLQGLLLQRMIDGLGLARRAGQAVAGHDKVQAFVAEGRAGLLLLASDAGRDAHARAQALGRGIAVVEAMEAFELGVAFARDQAVYVAVAPGRLAQRLEIDAARLKGLRGLPTAPGEQV